MTHFEIMSDDDLTELTTVGYSETVTSSSVAAAAAATDIYAAAA